ncbi:hypothetical protein BC833DRAFT_593462 [Globomyces pollinis-pini]|nr:hypothetical protein BC833DRAFT_593462 [Globomyces pollinis-pini]
MKFFASLVLITAVIIAQSDSEPVSNNDGNGPIPIGNPTTPKPPANQGPQSNQVPNSPSPQSSQLPNSPNPSVTISSKETITSGPSITISPGQETRTMTMTMDSTMTRPDTSYPTKTGSSNTQPKPTLTPSAGLAKTDSSWGLIVLAALAVLNM